MKFIIRPLLSILSLPALSRTYGWLTRRKNPKFLIKKIIVFFAKHYKINMDDYSGNIADYNSLSEFFIRKLNQATRPLIKNEKYMLSPADGFLTNIETVYEDKTTQVKGIDYNISEFIQDKIDYQQGWHIATIYLSPHDYHRFHHTIGAEIDGYLHKKGRLFPVNSFGTNLVKGLFNRNERLITRYKLNNQKFYVVAVGATFVGSIKMTFIENVKRDNKWKSISSKINQLDEMGRFEMGSTIIMVIPKSLATPIDNIIGKIKVSDKIFSLN